MLLTSPLLPHLPPGSIEAGPLDVAELLVPLYSSPLSGRIQDRDMLFKNSFRSACSLHLRKGFLIECPLRGDVSLKRFFSFSIKLSRDGPPLRPRIVRSR